MIKSEECQLCEDVGEVLLADGKYMPCPDCSAAERAVLDEKLAMAQKEIESLRAQLTEAKALVLEEVAGYQADTERYFQQLADLAEDDQAKAVRIRELEAQSVEAVVFSCHGAHALAYSCNKHGDQSGTYYKSPPAAKVPEGWSLLPEDLVTHIDDWRMACRISREQQSESFEDNTYWEHLLTTLDKIEAMISAREIESGSEAQ